MSTMELEARLEEWAEFYLSGNPYSHLDYPSESSGFKELRGGGQNNRRVPENPRAEQIERWVNELAIHSPDNADALRKFYFSSRNIPAHKLAKNVRCGITTLRRRIDKAKEYIYARLTERQATLLEVAREQAMGRIINFDLALRKKII